MTKLQPVHRRHSWIPALISFSVGCAAGVLFARQITNQRRRDRMVVPDDDATAELLAAEAEMEAVYQNALVQCIGEQDANGEHALKLAESQKAWLAFTEAHMAAIYPEEGEHGLVAELRKASIRAALTMEQTRQLREWWE